MTQSIQASLVPVAFTATFPAVQILLGGACDRQHNESTVLKIIILHVYRERLHPASSQRDGDWV